MIPCLLKICIMSYVLCVQKSMAEKYRRVFPVSYLSCHYSVIWTVRHRVYLLNNSHLLPKLIYAIVVFDNHPHQLESHHSNLKHLCACMTKEAKADKKSFMLIFFACYVRLFEYLSKYLMFPLIYGWKGGYFCKIWKVDESFKWLARCQQWANWSKSSSSFLPPQE